jgi:hypothetical protein
MPAMKKFVLFPGVTARASVLRQDGWSPAGLNWTKVVAADDGGTLYKATSGLDVGVTAACDPDSRDATSSTATAVVVSAAWYPSFTVTLTSYVPSCIGVQVNALAGLKSRTTWNAPPCGAALN